MKISVVIPAYNIEDYIERAIDSVLAQSRPPEEIIVVDDGSTDATAQKIKAYGDQVRYIHQANKGLSGARNTGIRQAQNEWVAFLDGDDEWLPEKLQLQSELLIRNPELSWVGGNYLDCDCTKNHTESSWITPLQKAEIKKEMKTPDFFNDYFSACQVRAAGNSNTMMIRKDALVQVGLFCEDLVIFEDLDMWFRLAYLDLKYGFVFEPLAVYHRGVQGSLTQRFIDLQYIDDYIQRHMKLSTDVGKLTEFQKCTKGLLSSRARLFMLHGKGKQIRNLVRKYGEYLKPSFRASCYMGSFCPPLWNAKEIIKKQIRSILKPQHNDK
ncbi:MAG: glycosyltransferase family 2 protein [Planctomycetota bacterium]|jgi:glycosyltransferase involved in cell wall biosynthesis